MTDTEIKLLVDADACPVKAIDRGAAMDSPPNFSSHSFLKKWTVNAEKCFKFSQLKKCKI